MTTANRVEPRLPSPRGRRNPETAFRVVAREGEWALRCVTCERDYTFPNGQAGDALGFMNWHPYECGPHVLDKEQGRTYRGALCGWCVQRLDDCRCEESTGWPDDWQPCEVCAIPTRGVLCEDHAPDECMCPQQRVPGSSTCSQDAYDDTGDLCRECYDAGCSSDRSRCG